jgi:hypothetical protein
MLHTMLRFNALDLHDEHLVDEYAAVTDCEIYKFYYKDDFRWNEIRKKIRESADMEVTNYPAHYYILAVLYLDRYDFEKKIYRFTGATAIQNVNIYPLFGTDEPMCDTHLSHYIPKIFEALADEPFTMPGLPLPPADAQSILRQMDADKNTERKIFAKFNLTITYIDRWRRNVSSRDLQYTQTIDHPPPPRTLRMNAHLNAVNFYEDEAMTKLIYSVKP